MDRIQLQASKLWDLLFSEDTAATYQTTLNLTGTILKETAQLIWLIICSFFVFGAWFSDTTVKAGKSIRDWVDTQAAGGTASAPEKVSLTGTGKSLLETTRTGILYMLNQAREQLGVEPSEASISTVSQPVVKAVPPSAAVAPSATARPPAPVSVKPASDIDREEADDGWPQPEED